MYRGPIGKDETDAEMVVWFQEELAIPGGKRAEFYARKMEKNVESCTNLVEKNRNRDLINGIFTIFQGESRCASRFSQNPV